MKNKQNWKRLFAKYFYGFFILFYPAFTAYIFYKLFNILFSNETVEMKIFMIISGVCMIFFVGILFHDDYKRFKEL